MIRIEYSNVCDLDNVLFSAGYVQNIYLDVEEMFAPEYEYFEDGTEDRNRNFVPSFKKQTKRQVFRVMATPYMADCLQNIPLCKEITIEIDSEVNKCEMFACTIVDKINKGKYYLMECSYETDQIISTGCCSNIRPTECLQTNVDNVIALIDCDSDIYTNPSANITEDSRYLVDFSNCSSKAAAGYKINIMYYSVSRGEWGLNEDNVQNSYCYNEDDGYYYYYTGSTWLVNPSIVSITNVAGNTYKIVGNAINGFVAVQATTDEVTWVVLDTFYASEIGNGVEVDILGTYTHIRLYQYSHGCDGTYGVSTASPNASDYISFTGVPVSSFAIDIGEVSTSESITVTEGVDATTNVVLTAPTGFQISQDDVTFTSVITLTVGYGSDVIYIRAASDSAATYSSNITAVVDSTTFNVAVYSVVTCSIAWISDWADDLENDTLSGYVEEKLDYITDTKDDIKTAIEAKGVTINPTDTFRDYATRIGSISSVCEGWYPPTDWDWPTASALITDSDNGFVALIAVYPNATNYFAIVHTMTASGGTIAWGDGSAAGVIGASGSTTEHIFDYSGITTAVTSAGYKVARVVFKYTGDLTAINLAKNHSTLGTTPIVSNKYVALKIRTQHTSLSIYSYDPQSGLPIQLYDLDTVPLYTVSSVSPFYGLTGLQSLTFGTFLAASQYAFNTTRCFNLMLNDIDISNVTNLTSFFASSYYTEQTVELDITAATNLQTMFQSCFGLSEIKLINTGNVTNILGVVYDAYSCKYFEMDDCSSVTTTTNTVHTVANTGNLTGLILTGLTVGINISYQYLGATAIDAFGNSIGIANGVQTIDVSNNPGAATCTASIFTTKGYTLIT